MGDSLSVRLPESFQHKKEESWCERVSENARAFFALHSAKPCAAGGASAFELLDAHPAPGTRPRQAASILVHGLVVAGLLVAGQHVVEKLPPARTIIGGPVPPYRWQKPPRLAEGPRGTDGSGGHLGIELPTAGEFAPRAQIVLLHPRVPDPQEHILPVEPTIFDSSINDAKQLAPLGLPNMKVRNDSNGPGKKDGIGVNGTGDTMGTGEEGGVGDVGDGSRAGYGAYAVKCLYCPDPEYTDEARQEKLQGSVTLRVLVTRDGRAGQVKMIKGLGLGLDERSVAAVRSWRFQPARDANRNPIAQWVTVETTYRLF
ncbi:MAG: hypothetical protein NVS9B14_10240 [Candidatus Acidiferrum sp.]